MIVNPLTTNVPIIDQCSHHIETSQLICTANQLTGYYMMGALMVNGLTKIAESSFLIKILRKYSYLTHPHKQ